MKTLSPLAFLTIAALQAASAATAQNSAPWPQASSAVKPSDDAFYKAPPVAVLEAMAPGSLMRHRAIPTSTYGTFVSGYQLMFRTTDQRGRPAAAITTVLVPG